MLNSRFCRRLPPRLPNSKKPQLFNFYAYRCRSGRNSTNGARFVNYSYGFSNIIVGTNNYWMTSGFTFGCPRIHHFHVVLCFGFNFLFWCSISGTILLASTLPPVDRAKSSIWIVDDRCAISLSKLPLFPYNGREMEKTTQ